MNRLPKLGIAVLLFLQTLAPTASAAPLSWQPQGSLPANSASTGALGVIYGKGQFLVTDRMAGTYTSSDAKAWTSHAPTPWISPIKFLNGRFFGGGTTGNGKYLAVSDDGLAWRTGTDSWAMAPVADVAYGKGRYVMGLFNGVPTMISSDLKTMTYSQSPVIGPMRGVTYGKGLFVGAADGMYYSADGLTWTEAVPPLGAPASGDGFTDVVYGGGRFVAVGLTGMATGTVKGVLYTSTDGKRWAQAPIDATGLYGVAFGGGRFVAFGPKSIITSEDGEHWTAEANGSGAMTFAYGAGKFVAVAPDRTVMAAAVCGSRFPDVAAGHSACDAVEALSRQQILSGYPDGSFRPGTAVTRAELAKMLTLVRGLKPEPTSSLPFSDTAGHWAASSGYLQAAVTAGMINGFPDGTFRPNQPVTRAEAAKMVAAAAGLQPGAGAAYRDITGGDWFAGWVAAARGADLLGAGGYHSLWAEQDFRGNAAADRGEAATLLDNLGNY
ncbi:MAG: hypothetical protein JWN15_422 [Firmicutes bacterium]|nr:hypothetical protein [Bacillota bacterium]